LFLTKVKGLSIKEVRTKLQKIDLLPPCAQNIGTGLTPLVRADTS